MNKNWDYPAACLFSLVFCDALITYFTKRVDFSHIAIVTATLYWFYIIFRGPSKLPGSRVLLLLMLFVVGFITAIPLLPELGFGRILEICSAVLAFLVGFAFFQTANDEDKLSKLFLFLSLVYGIVCILALSKGFSSLFPLQVKLWLGDGVINERPAIMTDQNFQIFYLFPAALLFCLPVKKIRIVFIIISIVLGAYTLAKLQTRSGVLILFGTIGLSLLVPLKVRSLGVKKVMVLPILCVLGVIVALPVIVQEADLVIQRFINGDFHTATGRLYSFIYLFEKVWNPLWWLPRGNAEFIKLTGNVPHSNITAMFLEGGLLGLISWIGLLIFPLCKYCHLLIKGALDHCAVLLFLAGVIILVTQLSLNVPVMDQIWLWTGGLSGGLSKHYKKASVNQTHD